MASSFRKSSGCYDRFTPTTIHRTALCKREPPPVWIRSAPYTYVLETSAVETRKLGTECVSKQVKGHLADIRKTTENMNSELENKITKFLQCMNEKLAKVDEVEKQLADKAECMRQLEEKLTVEKDAIRKERDVLKTERKSLDSEIKKMKEINKIQENTITLDVGGQKYKASISTLTKDANSMLSVMFSGRHSLEQSKDGSYFVDRDGTHFRYVLNYLRDGGTKLNLPADPHFRAELKTEAEYYQLDGLVEILNGDRAELKTEAQYNQLPSMEEIDDWLYN